MIESFQVKILHGPNYWSVKHANLIVLKLKIQWPQEKRLEESVQKVEGLFPGLSKNISGEYAIVSPAELVKYIALELQHLAGISCRFGAVSPGGEGEYFVAFEYEVPETGVYAGRAAVELLNILEQVEEASILQKVDALKQIKRKYSQGPTAKYLLEEVRKREIPIRYLDAGSLVTLGYGNRQRKMRTTVVDSTSGLGLELSADKEDTRRVLYQAGLPVPKGIVVFSEEELLGRLNELKFPLVIKPVQGNHGRGVTTKISGEAQAVQAFKAASRISGAVIVEEFIPGQDFRFLVVNYKLVAAARRIPPEITGDGTSTIRQLIDAINKDPRRGDSFEHILCPVKIDDSTKRILSEKQLSSDSVLKAGESLVLKYISNISSGGIASDVTDEVHKENKFMVERIARTFNLNICGIDIISNSVEEPVTSKTGAVIEVNAGPGIRMHSNPQSGKAINVAKPIVDLLFPSGSGRIPVVAVTGENYTHKIVSLIASIADLADYKVGFTTPDGVSIDKHIFPKENSCDFKCLQDLLFDPMINFAVLNCPSSTILQEGLPFSTPDIAIVDGISTKETGKEESSTIEQMAKVQMTLPLTVGKENYAILNADDELVYKMYPHLECKIALYSADTGNFKIEYHRKRGGIAAVAHQGYIMMYDGDWSTKIRVHESYQDIEKIRMLLPVSLVGMLMNFKQEFIRKCFVSPETQ